MKSFEFKIALVILLVISVGWKLIPTAHPAVLNDELVGFLNNHSFIVTTNESIIDDDTVAAVDVPVIEARKETCSVIIARLNFDGSNQQSVRRRLSGADRRFVVFWGNIYTVQPLVLTVMDRLFSIAITKLRLGRRRPPAIAVGLGASCAADLLPWRDINW